MTSKPVPPQIGRFKLIRELGRGAQAVVWLAHDTRLEREVALKLLDGSGDAVGPWLHEARAVSRLSHPHIVPVFEADEAREADGRPYLVFEYVKGPTLSAHLRQRGGALPAREAVTLMLGVLDALRAAHDCGIVHRDLKPSNILIDADGRARVMDFGIAARIADDGSDDAGTICGTPGYISPEAARGAAPRPAMDLFAAGVMLAEMLSGQRLLKDPDPLRALERVQREDLLLPAALANGEPVNDALRAIVQRALARDGAARWATAASLHQALQQWLQGGAAATLNDEPQASAAAAANATLDFLLRRMKHRSDFPALSDSVVRIQRVANSEHENLQNLSAEILKDVALTNKLLRMVNSANYSAAGGAVSTVSRAVALVGFAGIRNMALSLVLLDHMQDKGHATQLKEEFLRALMVGTLAGELTPVAREAEETFLSAMFQNLGRLLVEFYFPDEARQIRASSEPGAAQRVLGIGFEALGLGVAKSWGLPETLQRAMRVPEGEAPAKPVGGAERQRWLGRMAAEVTDALLQEDGPRSAAKLEAIAQRYKRALGVEPKQLQAAAEQAQQRLTQLAQAMNIDLSAKARARRLLAAPVREEAPDSLAALTLKTTDLAPLDAAAPTAPGGNNAPTVNIAELLANGVQDIANHMVADGCKLNEVLRMILETMYRALGFRRIVFCLRDARTDTLTGRFGLGDRAAEVAAAMKVPLKHTPGSAPDLFTAVCAKGADTLIADATVPAIAQRLPAWFAQHIAAPSFLLLPLMMKNAPFALIYADQAHAGGITLGEKELALLRTLRNQGVMAFRQAG